MPGTGGTYRGPGGQELHGDGQKAERDAVREKYQKEKPSLAQALANENLSSAIPLGEFLQQAKPEAKPVDLTDTKEAITETKGYLKGVIDGLAAHAARNVTIEGELQDARNNQIGYAAVGFLVGLMAGALMMGLILPALSAR